MPEALSYCEMTIFEVLETLRLKGRVKGIFSVLAYWTFTWTKLPGLLHGFEEGVQAEPVTGQVVVTLTFEGLMPGNFNPLT